MNQNATKITEMISTDDDVSANRIKSIQNENIKVNKNRVSWHHNSNNSLEYLKNNKNTSTENTAYGGHNQHLTFLDPILVLLAYKALHTPIKI